MPIVNKRYYMNPSYGQSLERARQINPDILKPIIESLESGSIRPLLKIFEDNRPSPADDLIPQDRRQEPPQSELVSAQTRNADRPARAQQGGSAVREPQESAADGHWVTIDRRHVFIDESPGDRGQHASSQRNRQKRKDIADIAKGYDHSTAWAFDKKRDDFPAGSNKCNKFVYDVTEEAGAKATVIGSDGKARPPLAAEWADPNTVIPNWRVLGPDETPQPGDIAAYKLPHEPGHAPYTGHSGIVTSVDSNGTVHAIAAHDKAVGPDDKFNPGVGAKVIAYRRFTGGR